MRGRPIRFSLLATLVFAPGCSDPAQSESTEMSSLALDACEEMVPANRFVDGIPAYAQCAEVENGSIWSNNGIDTSTTQLGPDWVQTQRGGGYQCTELAYRYMRFRWNVSYRSGNAQEWCDGNLPSTLVKSQTPTPGDLIVFQGGVCGAATSTGHVAVVAAVDAANGRVTIVEQNRAGRRTTEQSCATCFLHAVANDGSMGGAAGATGASGASGMSSATSGSGGMATPGPGGAGGPGRAGGAGGSASAGAPSSVAGMTGVAGSGRPMGFSGSDGSGTGGSSAASGSGGTAGALGGQGGLAGAIGSPSAGVSGSSSTTSGAGGGIASAAGGLNVNETTPETTTDGTEAIEAGCSVSAGRQPGLPRVSLAATFLFALLGWQRRRSSRGHRV